MPRPKRVIGHLTPWVEWCDELEAENKRLKSRGIEDMQHELAELRKAARELTLPVRFVCCQCSHSTMWMPDTPEALLQEKGE